MNCLSDRSLQQKWSPVLIIQENIDSDADHMGHTMSEEKGGPKTCSFVALEILLLGTVLLLLSGF